jgi:hypothetical protein
MANSFLFRITDEGVDELKRKLEALGPSGKAAFDTIANASPRLANSLDQAQSRMDQTRSKLEALKTAGESTSRAFETLNRGLALFGVGLGIEKVIEFGKRSIENVASLKDLSTQIGVTTKDFQVYQYAARQNSVATQAWQSGLATLTREIGDAVAGNKDAIDLFKRLNIEFKDGAGNARATGEAARDLAQRIHDSASAAQQSAIASDALGRVGRQLIPIFKEGADGLDKFAASAKNAGEVLDDETIERLNRADTTFKNLAAHMEIFFAEGIDNGIEVAKAFGNMAVAAEKFAAFKIDVGKINGQIDSLQKQLQEKAAAYNNDKNLGLNLYSDAAFDADQRRIRAQVENLKRELSDLTNPPVKVIQPPESSFEKPGRSGSAAGGSFTYSAASTLGPALQAGADQIAILRQVAGLSPAARSVQEPQLAALYGARRNTDPAISGAADQFADQARTQAILKQTQAIADQNQQIETNTALTGKSADAWLQSDAAGQRADAQRQAALEELTTGYSAAARAAQIMAQQAADAALRGAQQLDQLRQAAAEAEAQAAAAANGPAALASAQLAQKIAAATRSLKASLENAAGDDADRLRREIDGITESLTRADEAAKKLRLETSLFDQQDEIGALREQLSLVGEISGVQAVQVAHLEAINKLQREGADLASDAAKAYVANAEQIASLKDQIEISQREAELMLEPAKNAIQGLQSAWTDGWEKVLSGDALTSFSDFFSTVKQMGIHWAAEMVSLLTFRPAAGSILGAVAPGLAASLGFGGAAAAAQNSGASGITSGGSGSFAATSSPLAAIFGGAGGATSGLGSWLFGSAGTGFTHTGAAVGAQSGLFGSMPGMSSFFNSGLGTGLIGAGVSAALTAASGGSGLQSAVSGAGSLIGGIAGSYFGPAGSMAGSALGGIAGNIIGSLFGGKDKKPPKQQSITGINALASGYFGAGDTVTKHTGDATSELGKNATNALNTFLASIGGTVNGSLGGQNQLLYYGRTPRYMSVVGGVNNQYGEDAQGAQDAVADFIARTMVAAAQSKKLDGVSESVRIAIANSGAKDAAALDAAVAFGKFYDRIDQIREPADAAAKAMADLSVEMSKAEQQAQDYGLSVAKLPEIFRQNFIDGISDQILQLKDPTAYALKQMELERAAALAQATKLGADINAVEELYGLKRQAIVEQGLQGVSSSFQDFFNALLTDSNLSALSPQEQYKVSKAAFEGASNDNLIAAASPFLQASRGMFASSKGYADDFRAVLDRVKEAGGITSDIPFFAKGGDHPGGWMVAGEEGAELIATGAARVFDAETTAAIMAAANADLSPKLLAKIVRSFGEGPDTELAHLTPDEISRLVADRGGVPPGINPRSGLLAFRPTGSWGGTDGRSPNSSRATGGDPSGRSAAGSAYGGGAGGYGGKGGGFKGAANKQTAPLANPAVNPSNKNLGLAGPDYSGPMGAHTGVDNSNPANAPGKQSDKGGGGWDDSFGPAPKSVMSPDGFFDASKIANTPNGPVDADKFFHDWADSQGIAFGDVQEDTFWDKLGNWLASFAGFNEINPLEDKSYNLPGNPAGQGANWGFDPAGLIGSLIGMGVGLPFGGGVIADFISRMFGRPLEIPIGPSVFGAPDNPMVADGVANALAAQGASDISIGNASISANTPLSGAGVLAGGDIPRALSSVVTGGGSSGSLKPGLDQTARGTNTTSQQLSLIAELLKSNDDKLGRLLQAQAQTNDTLKFQARGSTKI